MAVTARVRVSWVRFRECEELLLGNRFPLRMKSKVCPCVRSAILYGSEAWCLKENEKAILRRMERAMVRASVPFKWEKSVKLQNYVQQICS